MGIGTTLPLFIQLLGNTPENIECLPQEDQVATVPESICQFNYSMDSGESPVLEQRAVESSESPTLPLIKAVDPEWTEDNEKLFDELATKYALEEISEEEQAVLDGLEYTRNLLASPRSLDEIIRERKRERIVRKLIESFEEYVDFAKLDSSSVNTNKGGVLYSNEG